MAILVNTQIRNDLYATGSIEAGGGFTGSLWGTSSFAVSASYALSASYAANSGGGGMTLVTGSTYPITSSWAITASYISGPIGHISTASFAYWADTASFAYWADTASFAYWADTASFSIYSETSAFSMESQNSYTSSYIQTPIGEAFFFTASVVPTDTSSIAFFLTNSFNCCFIKYLAIGNGNLRAGNITSVWSGSVINNAESTTTDVGNTTGLNFMFSLSGPNAIWRAENSNSDTYQIKSQIVLM